MRPGFSMVLALGLAALACGTSARAASPVWKVIAPDGGTLYLGGSVHALRKADYPLPPAFDRAFAASARLVFEADEGSAAAAKKLFKNGEYPSDDSLKNHVDGRTYAYLQSVFRLLGVPEAKFSRYRPWLLTVMLWSPSLQGFTQDSGVEGHLQKRARAHKKPTSGLVTMAEHLAVFSGLSDKESEAVLLLTFIPSKGGTPYARMLDLWRKGEVDTLTRRARSSFADYPAFADRILGARNRVWLPRIERYLRSGEVHFVVVGAAHLGGGDGLLALLKERGYQLEQL